MRKLLIYKLRLMRQDRVERLHKLTLENCPVGILFEKAGVKINYRLNVTKE